MDHLFADAVRQLLADQCTPPRVRDIEAAATAESAAPLWRQLEDAGFADALVPEDAGGAGLGLAEIYPVLELCGQYAMPLPLGDTLVARALLARQGVARPVGSIALAPNATLTSQGMQAGHVHHGAVADWVLAQRDKECRLLPGSAADRAPSVFCLDAVLGWPLAVWEAAPRINPEVDLRILQACVLAAQLAGALLAVFDRTLQYANERIQFGKPIGKLQAIQHQLSVISEHAFAARMAARIGCHCADLLPQRLRVAVAKARTGEAAVEVAALAHAIHGAIGFTAEFDLQLYTRRLHAWRHAAGSESFWHDVVGAMLLERQDDPALDLIRDASDIH
ncbi:MAG: acyl-CoA dehydrogenase family protein [Burkholderiales bacterium]